MTTITYCCECDAEPGDCTHTGNRYLDPIQYQPVTLSNGTRAYAVPAEERPRWNSDQWTGDQPTPTLTPQPDPLTTILTRLEPHLFIDDNIRTLLTDAHQINPLQTTQLALRIQRGAPHLERPAGALVKGLRQIVAYD